MKACFATNGFGGKIDCEEWAKDTNYKSLPKKKEEGGYNMYRPKNCKKCGGKMQAGGSMPRQEDYGTNVEAWQQAVEEWMSSMQQPIARQSDFQDLFQPIQENQVMRPPADASTQQPLNRIQEGIQRGFLDTPKDFQGTPQDYYNQVNAPRPKQSGNPFQTLQNVGIGLQGARTGLGWLAGIIERNRQNKADMEQQTALGQMNPMPASDFQPNPYSLYAKYGGNLKTIMRDFQKWSNDAGPMDMTEGKGNPKLKKGGYEIDRMLIVRKLLPELLNLGRMGSNYRKMK